MRYGQAAVALDPGHFNGWNLLGSAYYAKGEFALSAEAYGKAAEIKPGDGDVQQEPRSGPGRARGDGEVRGGPEEVLRPRRERRHRLLPGQALLQRRALRRGPGLRPPVHPEERPEPESLQPQGRHPEPARPLCRGRRQLPGRASSSLPADVGLQVNLGIALHQQRRAGQGQDRPRSGAAQDRAGRGPEASGSRNTSRPSRTTRP
ncbi:MAG: hypothetical protein M0C28_12150 [Candidatus Moduliflexus flocculans]|nr:hypothetical protein [Candidatus Moduliflexus flocculans]